jgi:ribonuclease E
VIDGAAIAPEVEPAPIVAVPEITAPEAQTYVIAEKAAVPRTVEMVAPQQPAAEEPPAAEEAVVVAQPEVRLESRAELQPEETPRAQERPPALPELKLEWPAGLVQIETDPHKAETAAQGVADEAPAPRPRRARPAPAAVSDEPLVQVETRKPEASVGG